MPEKGYNQTEEHKRRLRENHRGFLGRHHSEETKRKIGESKKGLSFGNKFWLGKKLSEEHKKKMSEAQKGKKKALRTAEHCRRISEAKMGKSWGRHTEETKRIIGEKMNGRKYSIETRKRISEAQKKLVREGRHPFLKDGRSKENYRERCLIENTWEYKEWRRGVFQRDNYTCQMCGQNGGRLNAHHIKPFVDYPSLRVDISNGLTLCIKCHKKLHYDYEDANTYKITPVGAIEK